MDRLGACGLGQGGGCGSLSNLVLREAKGPAKRASKTVDGGIQLQDGVCAVVECSEYSKEVEEVVQSDLFTPLKLGLAGEIEKGDTPMREYYLANVDAFKGPCSVIPDIGGHPSSYFLVKNRSQWSKEFIVWLNQPHKDDEMEFSDEEE